MLHDGDLVVAGLAKEGRRAIVARAKATPGGTVTRSQVVWQLDIPEVDRLELLVGGSGVALLRWSGRGADAKAVLQRFDASTTDATPVVDACATAGGIAIQAPLRPDRNEWPGGEAPFRTRLVGFVPGSSLADGPRTWDSGPRGGLFMCGADHVFLSDDGGLSLWTPRAPGRGLSLWTPRAPGPPLRMRFPAFPTLGCPAHSAFAAEYGLVEVRSECSGKLDLLTWQDGVPAKVVRIHGWEYNGPDILEYPRNIGLEIVIATPGLVGIAGERSLPPEEPCSAPGDRDTVMVALVADRGSGRPVVAERELARSHCARLSKPLGAGWIKDRLAVAWGIDHSRPTEEDPRYAGFGFAVFDPATGAVTTGRVDAPANALAFAGCDAERCFVAALTPAPGAVSLADRFGSGIVHGIAFP